MSPVDTDTIVASATPWGRSALAVLRLSGADALAVAQRLCPTGARWRARRASLRQARRPDGSLLDELLVTWMPGPRSYTGEDVVELACHGNPVVVEQLLDACVQAGARPARPGEFTRRALQHGRVDLVGAEATAELIAARSPAALAVVRAASEGLGPALGALRQALLDLASELEARLDHPGEDLGEEDDAQVIADLHAVADRARALAGSWRAGRVRLHGARIALIGPVNAGKSSLFNALLQEQRALVSDQPGTTRDVVERSVLVDGLELTLLDTAGERDSDDPLEQAGIALAQALVEDVDLVVVVLPGHLPSTPIEGQLLARTAGRRRLVVLTHADLPAAAVRPVDRPPDHRVSSRTGHGVAALRQALRRRVVDEIEPGGSTAMVVNQRQHQLLQGTAAHAQAAAEALGGFLGPAIAAEECTRALDRLGALSGADVREDVLDRLFARFCIGK